jgi:bile acid:Na+ symporter, BASS family
VVMFGLGLSLTLADFAQIVREPRAVAVALATQVLLLPAVCFVSAVVLVLVIAGALLAERENLGTYLADVGIVTTLFCVCSLVAGFAVPRLFRVDHRQAVASAFEVGIHNSTLAIAVALTVLGDARLAVPAAVYGVLMFPLAAAAGYVLARRAPAREPVPLD